VDVTDRKRLLAALVLTLSMMIAEIVGGLVSGSLSLLSDAGHMLTDAAALLLSFLALKFAAKPSDERRTYGFFRFEILSAFTNALTLILMAVVISWEAIQRLHSPEPIRAGIMMAVAAVGLVVNLGGMALLSKSKSMNVRGAFLHVLGDALSSVGVLVAAAITWWTGWTLLDPILSIVIAAVIAFGAIRLLRQAIHILIEGAPDHAPFGEVVQALLSIGGVTGVHDLHIWTIGQNKHSLTAHVVVDAACALDDYARILAEAREVLAARFRLDHSTLQLESAASQAVASAASVASEGVVPKPAAGV
jgi:cobalt-zinc-cadmium efflux system protein